MAGVTVEKVRCAYCGEEITEEPVKKGGKPYCCEACAFEGSKGKACDGRELM